jgi:cytidylate kinase
MITLYNVKGGVGKSSIAFQLAKYYDLPLYTNDIYSALAGIHKIDPKEKKNELPDCVLDLGGFSDHRIASYIKNSDVIIVPTLYSKLDLQSSLTIYNASSSMYTLTAMTYVAIGIPFVLAYVVYVWFLMDSKKLTKDEVINEESY